MFDPESQRSKEKIDAINLLPAHEFPIDEAGISLFRSQFREQFQATSRLTIKAGPPSSSSPSPESSSEASVVGGAGGCSEGPAPPGGFGVFTRRGRF